MDTLAFITCELKLQKVARHIYKRSAKRLWHFNRMNDGSPISHTVTTGYQSE